MIKTIFKFFPLILFAISCTPNNYLPNDILIKFEKETGGGTHTIRIYKIEKFNVKQLNNYPQDYRDLKVTKWITNNKKINNEYIDNYEFLRWISDFLRNKDLNRLINNYKIENKVLFSGYYKVMKSNERDTYKAYDYMYFIDLIDNKIYEFEEIKDMRF